MSSDAMLSELYSRAFETKQKLELDNFGKEDTADRLRQVALAESTLLNELIGIRTNQIRAGRE